MTYVNDFCTDVHSLDFHHFATADSAITNSLVLHPASSFIGEATEA